MPLNIECNDFSMKLFIFFLWPANFSCPGQRLLGLFYSLQFSSAKPNLSLSLFHFHSQHSFFYRLILNLFLNLSKYIYGKHFIFSFIWFLSICPLALRVVMILVDHQWIFWIHIFSSSPASGHPFYGSFYCVNISYTLQPLRHSL